MAHGGDCAERRATRTGRRASIVVGVHVAGLLVERPVVPGRTLHEEIDASFGGLSMSMEPKGFPGVYVVAFDD
jgi:hypothetical protein